MKRAILLSMVGVVTLSVYALAQPAGDVPMTQVTPTQAQPQNAMMGRCSQRMARQSPVPPTSEACPMCEMALGMGTPKTTPRLQKMMASCMNMMQAPFLLDSPSSIYSQSAKLKLSDQQKAKLIEIQNEAREKALAVLTPEQRKKIDDISANMDTNVRKNDENGLADQSVEPTTQPTR